MTRLKASGAAAIVAGLVLAAYALLLPGGRWEADDYFGAWLVDQGQWGVLLNTLHWAPRPIGLPLAWLYQYISDALDQPLAAVFLGLLWIFCLGWITLAGWAARQRHPLFVAMVLFALTLMMGKPGEMFYWPAGAAAYLPCWAGLAGATVLLRSQHVSGPVLMACLLLACLNHEVGAVAVLIYASLAGAISLRARTWRQLWPLIVPTIGAAAVCVTVALGRMQPMREVMDPASGLAGHWWASFDAGLRSFADDALRIGGLPLAAGAAIKLLLVACLPPYNPSAGKMRVTGAIWACALMLAVLTSEVVSYHQFGTQCCERQATQRSSMVLLALLSLSALLPTPAGWFRWLRPAALVAILIGLLGLRAGALAADWRIEPLVLAAWQRTWSSGRGPGDAMTLVMAPPARITNSDRVPPGHFRMCGKPAGCDVPWFALGVMGRFHKRELTIIQEP